MIPAFHSSSSSNLLSHTFPYRIWVSAWSHLVLCCVGEAIRPAPYYCSSNTELLLTRTTYLMIVCSFFKSLCVREHARTCWYMLMCLKNKWIQGQIKEYSIDDSETHCAGNAKRKSMCIKQAPHLSLVFILLDCKWSDDLACLTQSWLASDTRAVIDCYPVIRKLLAIACLGYFPAFQEKTTIRSIVPDQCPLHQVL